MRLAVLGAGSWGTALAIALAPRFDSVRIWARDAELAAELNKIRENRRYLAGVRLPQQALASAKAEFVLEQAENVLAVVPSRYLRQALTGVRNAMPRTATLVSGSKGLEHPDLCRMSEVISGVFPQHPVAVLSGPTFAKEIAAGEPAAVVIASEDLQTAELVQHAFATPTLRLYASTDVVGTELGAALKN